MRHIPPAHVGGYGLPPLRGSPPAGARFGPRAQAPQCAQGFGLVCHGRVGRARMHAIRSARTA